MAANQVVVGPRAELSSQGCVAMNWNWVMPPLSAGEVMNVQVKAHYRQSPIPAELSIDPDHRSAYGTPSGKKGGAPQKIFSRGKNFSPGGKKIFGGGPPFFSPKKGGKKTPPEPLVPGL